MGQICPTGSESKTPALTARQREASFQSNNAEQQRSSQATVLALRGLHVTANCFRHTLLTRMASTHTR